MLFSHAYFSGAHLPFSVALWWKDMVAVRVVAFAVFSWDDEVKEKERGLNCFPHLVFNSSVKRRICFCVMIKGHVHYYFSRAVFVSPVCFVIPFLLISKHSFFVVSILYSVHMLIFPSPTVILSIFLWSASGDYDILRPCSYRACAPPDTHELGDACE